MPVDLRVAERAAWGTDSGTAPAEWDFVAVYRSLFRALAEMADNVVPDLAILRVNMRPRTTDDLRCTLAGLRFARCRRLRHVRHDRRDRVFVHHLRNAVLHEDDETVERRHLAGQTHAVHKEKGDVVLLLREIGKKGVLQAQRVFERAV